MPRIEHEHLEQTQLILDLKDLAKEYPELWGVYAVPNESGKGVAGMIRSKILKMEGVKKGVSDLVLPMPRVRPGLKSFLCKENKDETIYKNYSDFPFFMGLYVEMKRLPNISPVKKNISYNKPSPEQAAFLDFVRSQGYIGECCNGRDEALKVFEWYLQLERIPADDLQNDYSRVDFLRSSRGGPAERAARRNL